MENGYMSRAARTLYHPCQGRDDENKLCAQEEKRTTTKSADLKYYCPICNICCNDEASQCKKSSEPLCVLFQVLVTVGQLQKFIFAQKAPGRTFLANKPLWSCLICGAYVRSGLLLLSLRPDSHSLLPGIHTIDPECKKRKQSFSVNKQSIKFFKNYFYFCAKPVVT